MIGMLRGTYFVLDDDATAAEGGELNAQLGTFVKKCRALVKIGEPVSGNERVVKLMAEMTHRWDGRLLYLDGSLSTLGPRQLEHILFSEL